MILALGVSIAIALLLSVPFWDNNGDEVAEDESPRGNT